MPVWHPGISSALTLPFSLPLCSVQESSWGLRLFSPAVWETMCEQTPFPPCLASWASWEYIPESHGHSFRCHDYREPWSGTAVLVEEVGLEWPETYLTGVCFLLCTSVSLSEGGMTERICGVFAQSLFAGLEPCCHQCACVRG